MRSTITIAFATLFLIQINSCAQTSSLDGKTFIIEWYDANNPGSKTADTLIFDQGRVDCMQTHRYGFGAADYSCEKDGDKLTFKTTMTSTQEGSISWTGTVEGDRVSGEFYWPKEKMTFRFTGVLRS